jgi:hypothetical protein
MGRPVTPGTSAPEAGAADRPQRTAGHATAGTGVNRQPDGGCAGAAAEPDPRRWLVLAVIAVQQERGKAFGTYGAVAAGGGAVGLLLGGAAGKASPRAGAGTLVHGSTTAFWVTAGIFAAAAVLCGSLTRPGPLQPARRSPGPCSSFPPPGLSGSSRNAPGVVPGGGRVATVVWVLVRRGRFRRR